MTHCGIHIGIILYVYGICKLFPKLFYNLIVFILTSFMGKTCSELDPIVTQSNKYLPVYPYCFIAFVQVADIWHSKKLSASRNVCATLPNWLSCKIKIFRLDMYVTYNAYSMQLKYSYTCIYTVTYTWYELNFFSSSRTTRLTLQG